MEKFQGGIFVTSGCFTFFPLVHVEQPMTNGTSSRTICSHFYPGPFPYVSKVEQKRVGGKKRLPTQHQVKKKQKTGERKNPKCPQLPSKPYDSQPPPSIQSSCSLLKRPSPGRSGGGDTSNEDEYSAALESLLEACPACTCCSSQIGSEVGEDCGGRGRGLQHKTEVEKLWWRSQ